MIIGLIVWNSFPPTIIGAATADNPLRKTIIVRANKVGIRGYNYKKIKEMWETGKRVFD